MKYEFKISLVNEYPELIITERCDCGGVIDTIWGIYKFNFSEINQWEATRLLLENDFIVTISKGNPVIDESISAWLAIRDVLALHKKHQGMPNLQTPQGDFYQCVACLEIYPCPTIQKIMEELK
jgi:hypothetical protein